jgi:endonuclease/exonuclease/phosphatase family metal-dependent hydrolase
MKKQMRVMTFNLRFENDRDGKNAWVYRRDLVVEIIHRYCPDILGTQEGKWSQLTYLCEHLPEYEAWLPGRTPDKISQSPTLFFKKDRCQVKEGGDFWLSKTPDVHLSKSWDSAFPRMISYAGICDKHKNVMIVAAVTHLDHIGIVARYEQAKIFADWVTRQTVPVILMGDFNDDPSSNVHKVLTVPETNLQDTWKVMNFREDADSYTHHGFNGIPQLSRMDWILVDSRYKVNNARIIHDQFNDQYPSDHFPYMAEIML